MRGLVVGADHLLDLRHSQHLFNISSSFSGLHFSIF